MSPNKNLNKLIFSMLILLAVVVVFDRIAGRLLHHYYFTQTSGSNYRTTFALDSTTADILVFGSSRASHHYVPQIFEDSLHMSFYNTGRDGNFLVFNYALFRTIINRYKPKIVLFDLNPDEFVYSSVEYERLSILLPYYRSNPQLYDSLIFKNKIEKFKIISAIYPYNSLLLNIIVGNLKYYETQDRDLKGYIALEGSLNMNFKLDTIHKKATEIDTYKIAIVNKIIDYCSVNKIILLFVVSPVYYVYQDNTLKYITMNNDELPIIDFSNLPEFNRSPDYFNNTEHLNNVGAIRFSSLLADSIDRTYFNKSLLRKSRDKGTRD